MDGRTCWRGDPLYGREGDSGRTFQSSDLLPAQAGKKLKCSAFVEINGDGYPDVVVSKVHGGLHVYLNPVSKGGVFQDATSTMGLDAEACGADRIGFFAPGDWNSDHRTDLFFAAGEGSLLLQDQEGRFAPMEHDLEFDFATGGRQLGLTGAGCFAPLWRPDGLDLVLPNENTVNWAGLLDDEPSDLMPYGNEIWEGANGLLLTVAEDLNADGNVDIYSGNQQVFRNKIHTNRGYGSFMTPLNYAPDVFPGQAHHRGAWGVAAGDVDGNWLESLPDGSGGKPAEKGPDADTDVLFPDSAKEFEVGFNKLVARHITVGSGVGLGADLQVRSTPAPATTTWSPRRARSS